MSALDVHVIVDVVCAHVAVLLWVMCVHVCMSIPAGDVISGEAVPLRIVWILGSLSMIWEHLTVAL